MANFFSVGHRDGSLRSRELGEVFTGFVRGTICAVRSGRVADDRAWSAQRAVPRARSRIVVASTAPYLVSASDPHESDHESREQADCSGESLTLSNVPEIPPLVLRHIG